MKSSVRLTVLLVLALAFVLVPEIPGLRVGEALAGGPTTPDFTLGTTKAEVTHETANVCAPGVSICSFTPYFDSDSYEVNAALDTSTQIDLDTDLTHNGLSLVFLTGTCASLGDLISWQVIPGNAIHKTSNKNFTIYSFEGNVPRIEVPDAFLLFDHLDMNLKIPASSPASSTLHVEANTNFCHFPPGPWVSGTPVTGPVAMIFDIGGILGESPTDLTTDNDTGCVDVTPEYNTLDVSSAICPVL